MNFATKLNQTAVYWAPDGTVDDFGNNGFAAGVELTSAVRWEDKGELFLNALGEQELSQSISYYDGTLALDGYLYLGTLASLSAPEQADPTIVRGAYRIRQTKLSPSVDASQSLRKTWL